MKTHISMQKLESAQSESLVKSEVLTSMMIDVSELESLKGNLTTMFLAYLRTDIAEDNEERKRVCNAYESLSIMIDSLR